MNNLFRIKEKFCKNCSIRVVEGVPFSRIFLWVVAVSILSFLCASKLSDFPSASCVRLGQLKKDARWLAARFLMTHQAQTRNLSNWRSEFPTENHFSNAALHIWENENMIFNYCSEFIVNYFFFFYCSFFNEYPGN